MSVEVDFVLIARFGSKITETEILKFAEDEHAKLKKKALKAEREKDWNSMVHRGALTVLEELPRGFSDRGYGYTVSVAFAENYFRWSEDMEQICIGLMKLGAREVRLSFEDEHYEADYFIYWRSYEHSMIMRRESKEPLGPLYPLYKPSIDEPVADDPKAPKPRKPKTQLTSDQTSEIKLDYCQDSNGMVGYVKIPPKQWAISCEDSLVKHHHHT